METKDEFRRDLIIFLIVFTIATIFLNLDIVQFQPLALWVKIIPPSLIAFGGLSVVLNIKSLRIVGWIGIGIFLAVSVMASFPSEDYLLGGPSDGHIGIPRIVSNANTLSRMTIGLVITALLFWRYRRLQVSRDVK